jgi:alkanesulfonate monooxygenase SsuD/methylene tetrahydromethanopterin reductase-like flavin-dependent oxidoreductase (luciferase family)
MTNAKIQFGWVMPPGARATEESSRFDAGIRHTLTMLANHFDSAWMTDHLQWGDDECLEAMTTLSFYAALFPRYYWGTMVACQSYRNPAYMAKIGSTIQYLTQGHLIMGIGAGWKEDEYHAYNYEFPSAGVRIAQLEETVAIFKRMWSQPHSSYEGKHYKVQDAINLPKTFRPPILMIGGGGEKKTLPVVARYADWWNVTAYADDYKRKVDILKRECDATGRDFKSLRLTWFGGVGIGKTRQEIERHTRDDFARNSGLCGTPDQIASKIQALIDAGCTYFMLDTRGVPDDDEMSLLIDLSRRWR